MLISATEFFDFLAEHPAYSVERHEISEPHFDSLRRNLRGIVERLSDCDEEEANDLSNRIRILLSEWLTVPVPFNRSILDAVQSLGSPTKVRRKWGDDVAVLYATAINSAQMLPPDNPVRTKLRSIFGFIGSDQTFRIYCHRSARAHFESLLVNGDVLLSNASFLHSLREYREARTFDVLIKVGPLRSRGWGSVPDALISAPRFGTLVQVVWRGCHDEAGFGYDPVAPTSMTPSDSAATERGDVLANMISWKTIPFSDRRTNDPLPEDEFQLFSALNQARSGRAAILVGVDYGQGVLFAPRSEILSFDPAPSAAEPIQFRRPDETLMEGMFVIVPLGTDADLGGPETRKGIYSRTWKASLAQVYGGNPDALVSSLRSGGIDLLNLHASIQRWSSSLDDILPAPGKPKHFEILIQVLGVNWDGTPAAQEESTAGWKLAWKEIRHARGEAIQIGRDEHELINEELVAILGTHLPDIRTESEKSDTYVLSIPSGRGVRGNLRFYKVRSVEEGFLAPETELGFVQELSLIEQWRV